MVLGRLTHDEPVRQTVEGLLGPGRQVDGGWVWDVRTLVG